MYQERWVSEALTFFHFVNIIFPNRWIGHAGPAVWPPRSLELNCLDFFLWGRMVNENTQFQQDGAKSHTARISTDAVNAFFPSRVISRNGDIAWPPRSPDLTVCDCFLWRYLKTKVFGGNPPRTIAALKQPIREEVAEILVNMLGRVMQQFVDRLEECVRFNGGHLADRLRVFENKVLRKIFGAKRDEVTGEWRKLHNTELHSLYSSPDIIRNTKSRRLRWARHVARMGESRNSYRVLVGRPEGKRPLGRPRRRWEDNTKMDLREVGYDDREWINLAQNRDQWRAYVRVAMNLRIP
ncbi:hypothetical protein ANN_14619 [Periplaneta americana]|uniref:Uncharacterized protein n=1 Tax=Periplaneta americana TaxID=6978 RepID=A0ABQ8SWS8_PERAM|nr:hypothetical protein ANN_14619 [Periplaneta americana]